MRMPPRFTQHGEASSPTQCTGSHQSGTKRNRHVADLHTDPERVAFAALDGHRFSSAPRSGAGPRKVTPGRSAMLGTGVPASIWGEAVPRAKLPLVGSLKIGGV